MQVHEKRYLNSLDIDYIHGNIDVRLCENTQDHA